MMDKIGYDWNAVPDALGDAMIIIGCLLAAGLTISWFSWVFGFSPLFNPVFIRFGASLIIAELLVFAAAAAWARYAAIQNAKRRVRARLAGIKIP